MSVRARAPRGLVAGRALCVLVHTWYVGCIIGRYFVIFRNGTAVQQQHTKFQGPNLSYGSVVVAIASGTGFVLLRSSCPTCQLAYEAWGAPPGANFGIFCCLLVPCTPRVRHTDAHKITENTAVFFKETRNQAGGKITIRRVNVSTGSQNQKSGHSYPYVQAVLLTGFKKNKRYLIK